MRAYEKQLAENQGWPKLRWQPVAISSFPQHLLRAVILAEDSRFYEHSGFDLIAFKEAMDYNLDRGRFVFGASTISQQTVKNLFLTPRVKVTTGLAHGSAPWFGVTVGRMVA